MTLEELRLIRNETIDKIGYWAFYIQFMNDRRIRYDTNIRPSQRHRPYTSDCDCWECKDYCPDVIGML